MAKKIRARCMKTCMKGSKKIGTCSRKCSKKNHYGRSK